MSGDSGRRLIIIALLAALSAIISYARGYFEEQNGKKLCRDAEAGSPYAKKMYAFFSKKEQKVKDALWSIQMLLLCFEGLIFGVLCHDIMDAIHEKPTFPADFPDLLLNVLVFLAGGLVFAFLYIVFIRRLFAAFRHCQRPKNQKLQQLWAHPLPLWYFSSLFVSGKFRHKGLCPDAGHWNRGVGRGCDAG